MTDYLQFGFWNLFVIWYFVFWLLFVICNLFFGYYLTFVIRGGFLAPVYLPDYGTSILFSIFRTTSSAVTSSASAS